MKNYIGYIRVSNKDHENSLPTQRKKLQEYAFSKELNLVHIYEEEKSAFKKTNRKVFQSMINHLRQEEIKGVIFQKVDRSARNMKDFALLEEFFDSKDILVIEGEFDTKRSQGRFMFRMFCNMAVWYSENLSEEVNSKMEACLERGYYPSRPYFGYRKGNKNDPDVKLHYPDFNAQYVREIFEMYDGGNHSYYSIAKLMREKGVKNTQGGNFTKGLAERLLRNPFYCGIIEWGTKRRSQYKIYKGNHQPLVAKELFERAKMRREGRTTLKGGYGKATYSRMFQCQCGHFLCPETPRGRNGRKDYTYLRCQNKSCSFSSIREDRLENLIIEELSKYKIQAEFFEQYKSAMKDMSEMILEHNREQRKEINIRLTQIENEFQRVRKGYIQEVFSAEEAKKMRCSLELEKDHILKTLNRESKALDAAYFKTAEQFLETFQIVSDRYKMATQETKREILDLFFSKRVVNHEKLYFEPTPIMQHVAVIANSQYGRGGNSNSEIISTFKRDFLQLHNFMVEQELVKNVWRFCNSFSGIAH